MAGDGRAMAGDRTTPRREMATASLPALPPGMLEKVPATLTKPRVQSAVVGKSLASMVALRSTAGARVEVRSRVGVGRATAERLEHEAAGPIAAGGCC